MIDCLIALGGNLDPAAAQFEAAVAMLCRSGVSRPLLSRTWQSRAMGAHAGGEFRNAALRCAWPGSAASLLQACHNVESAFGRTRTIHWGPRTLDLDLILFGSEVHCSPGLQVPHPAMWYRRFVLDPAGEVAANMIHPLLNVTVGELLRRISTPDISVRVCGGSNFEPSQVLQILEAVPQPDPPVRFQPGDMAGHGTSEFATVELIRRSDGNERLMCEVNERVIRIAVADRVQAIQALADLATAIRG